MILSQDVPHENITYQIIGGTLGAGQSYQGPSPRCVIDDHGELTW
jgi:hypothetical protein